MSACLTNSAFQHTGNDSIVLGPPKAVFPDWFSDELEEWFTKPNPPISEYALPEPLKNENGEPINGENSDWIWSDGRGSGPQAEMVKMLWALGLHGKAVRLRNCGQIGRKVECCNAHSFFRSFRCGLRFCPSCGPANYRRLFERHVRLKALVKSRKGWVLACLDFTLLNTGKLPEADQIKRGNKAVRRVMKSRLQSHKGAGYIFCDEFGFDNTNLHMHGIYYGPWLSLKKLREDWFRETGDSFRVGLKLAHQGFERALWHMLKYVSKAPSNNPVHLARLEAAFNRVRRVHALGAFYNPDLPAEEPAGSQRCPHCEEFLFATGPYCALVDLASSGLCDAENVRRELARQKVFSG